MSPSQTMVDHCGTSIRPSIEETNLNRETPNAVEPLIFPKFGYTKERNLLSFSPGSKRRAEYMRITSGEIGGFSMSSSRIKG